MLLAPIGLSLPGSLIGLSLWVMKPALGVHWGSRARGGLHRWEGVSEGRGKKQQWRFLPSLPSGWTHGLGSETSLFPCHFQTLSFRWGVGKPRGRRPPGGSGLQPASSAAQGWELSQLVRAGGPCCSGCGQEGVLPATSPLAPSLPRLRPLSAILPFCFWSFSLRVHTGKQEERTCEGEFGALCPHTSSSRAHLTISPGKLSVGEEGKGRVECSQSAGSVGGRVRNWRKGPGTQDPQPQKGSRRPHPSEVTTDTTAQESSTSLEKGLESGFGKGTELCGVA